MANATGTITVKNSAMTPPPFSTGSFVQCALSLSGAQVVRITTRIPPGGSWSGTLTVYWSPDGSTLYTVPYESIFFVKNGQALTYEITGDDQFSLEVGAATNADGFICVVATYINPDGGPYQITVDIATMELVTGAGVVTTVAGSGPGWASGSYVTRPLSGTGPQVAIITLHDIDWTADDNPEFVVYWSPDATDPQPVSYENVIRTDTGAMSPGGGIPAAPAQYSAQIGAATDPTAPATGAIYVVATGSGSGTIFVSIELQDCDMLLNVKNFGAVGNGIVDDTAAIQSAINFAVTDGNNQGAPVFFPGGIYLITSPLVMPPGVINLVLEGVPSAVNPSQVLPRSKLLFAPAGDYAGDSMISFSQIAGYNPALGFAIRDMGLMYQDPDPSGEDLVYYTGTLLDLRSNSAYITTPVVVNPIDSHGIEITRCSFYPFPGIPSEEIPASTNHCPAFAVLDGSIAGLISNCSFNGAQYAVQGLAQETLNSPLPQRGFQNLATFRDCQFAGQMNAPILNPGDSWTFDGCLVEAGGNPAAFIAMLPGYTCNNLCIKNCNFADDSSSEPGVWIVFGGSGLLLDGNLIPCQQFTTAVQLLAGSNCAGIVGDGNWFDGSGGVSTAFDLSLANSVSDFSNIGNSFTGIAFQVIPNPKTPAMPRSLYLSNTDLFNATNAQLAGQLAASNILAGTNLGTNLMPFNDATFTNFAGGLGYPEYDYEPSNCLLASASSSMAMTRSASGPMNILWPSLAAAPSIALPVVAGQLVTIIAKVTPGSSLANVYLKAYSYAGGTYTFVAEGNPNLLELASGATLCSLIFVVPEGVTNLAFELVVGSTSGSGDIHYVSEVSISIGTPCLYWYAPVSHTVTQPPAPLLQLTGTGLSQLGEVGSVTVNDNVGGTGGLVVGNGADSSLGGPISAGSLTLGVNHQVAALGYTSYTAAYTDWVIYCDATYSVFTVTIPGTGAGINVGTQFVIAKFDNTGNKVKVIGSFLGGGTEIDLDSQGSTVTLVCIQPDPSPLWMVIAT